MRSIEYKFEGSSLNRVRLPKLERECLMSIVIPVYAEPIDKVLSLVLDLLQQQNINPNNYEIVLAINSDNEESDSKIFTMNKTLLLSNGLRSLRARFKTKIHTLDLFSAEHYLSDCNAGKARDVAAKLICERYGSKRGVLMFIDADCRTRDTKFLDKILEKYSSDNLILGISGLVNYKFDDLQSEYTKHKLKLLCLQKQWKSLVSFINKIWPEEFKDHFEGSLMITDTWSYRNSGGIPHVNRGEDRQLGINLRNLSNNLNQLYGVESKVINGKSEFNIDALFRDSYRTGASFAPKLDVLRTLEDLMCCNPASKNGTESNSNFVMFSIDQYLALWKKASSLPGWEEFYKCNIFLKVDLSDLFDSPYREVLQQYFTKGRFESSTVPLKSSY